MILHDSLRCLLLWICWGRLWLLVVQLNLSIVSWYRNSSLQIHFRINYILHYYYKLINWITSTLVLCSAHHLMCWPETSDNIFKPAEKIFLGSFQVRRMIFSGFFSVWRKISLDFLLHVMCMTHLKTFCD